MSGPAAVRVVPVSWDDPRAVGLRESMDVELTGRYGGLGVPGLSETARRALAVDPADILATVLALAVDGSPTGHAALRMLGGEWEVKRVIVLGDQRGQGIGRALMTELERIAVAGGAQRLILHTGDRQPEAVSLYVRLGYTPIEVYDPYRSMSFSLCFEKPLVLDTVS